MAPEDTIVDHATTTEVREEPVEVIVEVIRPEDHAAGPDQPRPRVVREVLLRQLDIGHDLGTEFISAATTVSVAVAHAPASVIDEIRSGATLPKAFTHSGTTVREVVAGAGTSLRTAVGDYVGHQATLPSAIVRGASDIAESVLRAQGRVATSTVDATFTVATGVVHGADVRGIAGRERRAAGTTTDVARGAIGDSWDRAREEIRAAVNGFDER